MNGLLDGLGGRYSSSAPSDCLFPPSQIIRSGGTTPSGAGAPAAARPSGGLPHAAAHLRSLSPCSPFVPLLKVKGLTLHSTTRVPREPTLPGQKMSHHTLSMFGALAWLMPWNVSVGVGGAVHVCSPLMR